MNPIISILIVDDDLKKIYNIIETIKGKINVPLKIDQALDISEAIEYLKVNKYHLLISDLLMPLHKGDKLIENGGEILIKEIYKVRRKLNVPLYILGLTQHKDYILNFNKIWNVWYYNMSQEEWKIYLRDLIFHIDLIKSNLAQFLIETIFVEGINDEKLLTKATELYFEEKLSLFRIESGGGVDWVERKILIWSKSLNKRENGSIIKSVGLFDNDDKGLKSIATLNKNISKTSAESKTFSLIKTSYKYSILLKSIKSKGIEFKTTIEDLICIDVWKVAFDKGWLENRRLSTFINFQGDNINSDYLKSINLTDDEILLCLHKVKNEHKNDFTNIALEKKDNLLYVSFLLLDCYCKLKI